MGLSSTKITPVLDANCLNSANAASEVYPPLDGTTVDANDVGAGEQILRNQTHTLNELKANLTGATFTGPVIHNSSLEANSTTQLDGATTVTHSLGVALTGTQPAATADPGANNIIVATNIIKAWGTVSLTGGTPFAVQDAYNVTNVTEPIANIYQINFVRPFANTTYSVTFTPHSPGAGVSLSTKTTSTCRFNVWETDAPGTPLTNRTVDFQVVGRQ